MNERINEQRSNSIQINQIHNNYNELQKTQNTEQSSEDDEVLGENSK
jgi:hypothetical protein